MTEQLEAFKSGDGSHWGLTDLYPEKEAALKAALESGEPFDTGWYGSKKEIASGRVHAHIISDGRQIVCEASVSDDFDTPGNGESIAEAATLEAVYAAIGRAWDEATGDQKNNQEYMGYALFHWTTKIPEWRRGENVYPRETRKRYRRKQAQCLDYYIANVSGLEFPPGDNYHFWGWQNDCHDEPNEAEGLRCVEVGIPAKTVKAFEEFAAERKEGSLRIGDWEFRSWQDA